MSPIYLLLISLVGELHVDVVVLADLGDDRPLASDDLGVIFGVDRDGELKAPQSLDGVKGNMLSQSTIKYCETHVH